MIMDWKTDWNERDNYARAGVSDWLRLWTNYTALRDLLNSEFGFNIIFTAPAFDGYKTVPLADMLNDTEAALTALHVWPVSWISNTTIWQPGKNAPDHQEINRWECNGQAIDEQAPKVQSAFRHCGTFNSGFVNGVRL